MASDLGNFDTQMGVPHMCGEPGVTCTAGMPTFQHVYWNVQAWITPAAAVLARRRTRRRLRSPLR